MAGRAWVWIDCSLPLPAQELEHLMKRGEPDSKQAKGSDSSWWQVSGVWDLGEKGNSQG